MNKSQSFPIGASIQPGCLSRDPYEIYTRMRAEEPVSWLPVFGVYYVVLHEDVAAVLRDDARFGVGAETMLARDTFGSLMMTVDGDEHRRYRMATRAPFTPKMIREKLEEQIVELTDSLIDGFEQFHGVELRTAFASRLPIQVMLAIFGLPREDEALFRQWYDAFEAALDNYEWDESARANGKRCVAEFKRHMHERLDACRGQTSQTNLFAALVNDRSEGHLDDDEILQNALVIFFGGISTVEALIMNTFYSLANHPEIFKRVKGDIGLLPKAIAETIRWISPVQAVTRYVKVNTRLRGVRLAKGDIVNCMLASANRDERVFVRPEIFDIDRPDLSRHLAFATGPHTCLGSHLARAEVRIAISRILTRLRDCQVDLKNSSAPEGYEFRQPRRLRLNWS